MKPPNPNSPRCACGEVLSIAHSGRSTKTGEKVRAYICRDCGRKWRRIGDGDPYPAHGRQFVRRDVWDFGELMRALKYPETPVRLPGTITGYNSCWRDDDDLMERRQRNGKKA